jgi:hypothetical protein
MSDAQLWSAWTLWLGVAAVVVLIAAGLLVTILVTARGILAHAVRALEAAEHIRQDTLPIWDLATTNAVAGQLLETVSAIERDGGALAETLEAHAGSGGVRGP